MNPVAYGHQSADSVLHILKNFFAELAARKADDGAAFFVAGINSGGFNNADLLVGVVIQEKGGQVAEPIHSHVGGMVENFDAVPAVDLGFAGKRQFYGPRVDVEGAGINSKGAAEFFRADPLQ